jgi:O-antigen/teichoic acid export membrane protein
VSLRGAILASYASQVYVTIVGLVLVPVYLRTMGAENYGLVGFFLMLQGWFQLLDIGLTPTISREAARYNGGVGSIADLRQLVRSFRTLFVAIAVTTALLLAAAAGPLADDWLKFQDLALADVVLAIQLIGVVVALRLVCGLFRGVITGFEKLVWLARFNAGIATLRFVFVVPVLVFVGAGAVEFFAYQVAVGVVELAVLVLQTRRLLPATKGSLTTKGAWAQLKDVSRFSLTIAATSALSIVVTQIDKLALSRIISLHEFGYFTAAVLLAGGISILAGPVGSVLQPRLASLSASGDERALLAVYRAATQLVVVLVAPAVVVMAAFPEPLLWAWSGDQDFARRGAPILALYAIGNGAMALGALPFFLQFAKGMLRLHLIGSILFAAAFVPLCVWGALARGPVGAGLALIAVATTYFLLWVPRIHGSCAPGLHRRWLTEDIVPIALLALAAAAAARLLVPLSGERILLGAQLAAIAALSVVVAATGSTVVRSRVMADVRRIFGYGASG